MGSVLEWAQGSEYWSISYFTALDAFKSNVDSTAELQRTLFNVRNYNAMGKVFSLPKIKKKA